MVTFKAMGVQVRRTLEVRRTFLPLQGYGHFPLRLQAFPFKAKQCPLPPRWDALWKCVPPFVAVLQYAHLLHSGLKIILKRDLNSQEGLQ